MLKLSANEKSTDHAKTINCQILKTLTKKLANFNNYCLS